MIRIYASDPREPDFTLSGVFTRADGPAVIGYVTLDVPQTVFGQDWQAGTKMALAGPLLVVDAETMEILYAPWPTGAKVLRGLWAPQWVRAS